jgi:hypothetical protein
VTTFNPSDRFKPIVPDDGGRAGTPKIVRSHSWHRGKLGELLPLIPGPFHRVPFEIGGKTNHGYDVITTNEGTPLSIVSKGYSLIDHCSVTDSIQHALQTNGIDLDNCHAELYLGFLGSRFAFKVIADGLTWDPGDGKPIAATIAGLNSVDRTATFRLAIGFYRYICSNGIGWGLGRVRIVRAHKSGQIDQEDVNQGIATGLQSLDKISKTFRLLVDTGVDPQSKSLLTTLVEERWGKSKAQLLSGAWQTGNYGNTPISGINVPCTSMWDILNSLTWVASGQRTLTRQETMMQDCNDIIDNALSRLGIASN